MIKIIKVYFSEDWNNITLITHKEISIITQINLIYIFCLVPYIYTSYWNVSDKVNN